MIQIIFGFGSEKVLITIRDKDIRFGNTSFGSQMTSIDGLSLDYSGVCHEFPDLESHDDWRGEAIKRFKEKIENFDSEDEIADYLIEDLKKFGYIPEQKQKNGWRSEVIE